MIEIRETGIYRSWMKSLRDQRAKARIAVRIGRLADGNPGDVRPVATMGEALPQGDVIGRFALNSVAVAGPGGALTFATVAQENGERNTIYCRCPEPAP